MFYFMYLKRMQPLVMYLKLSNFHNSVLKFIESPLQYNLRNFIRMCRCRNFPYFITSLIFSATVRLVTAMLLYHYDNKMGISLLKQYLLGKDRFAPIKAGLLPKTFFGKSFISFHSCISGSPELMCQQPHGARMDWCFDVCPYPRLLVFHAPQPKLSLSLSLSDLIVLTQGFQY